MKLRIFRSVLFFIFWLISAIIFIPGCKKHTDTDPTEAVNQVFARVRTHDFEKNSGYAGVGDLTDEAWKVRLLAIRDVLRLGSNALPVLRTGLHDENRHVRHVCVTSLGISGAEDAGESLLKLVIEDPDPIVRGQAAQAIGQIGYKEGLSTLQEIAENEKNTNIKHRAGLAVGRLKEGAKTTDELLRAWKSLDESKFRQMQPGKSAPEFELKDTKGKTWKLSDFKGKKSIVLIWIFADWCGVCHHEFNDLIQLEEKFKEADIQVFTIECHDLYRCKVMVGGRELWWPHLVDNAGKVGAMYGVDPMEFIVHDEWINRPTTVIIDPKGIVRFAYYGTYWGDRPTIGQTLEMIKNNSYSFRHPERRE